jgi:fibronectin type 3 domain-containing protein
VGTNVYRATTSGGPYSKRTSLIGTSFTDNQVDARTTYYYIVRAVDGSGVESAASNQAQLTTR